MEALQHADEVALDQHLAGVVDRRRQLAATLHPPQQRGGAAVDEARDEALMESVGKLVLDRSRPLPPTRRVVQPGGAMRDVGPGADVGDPLHQRFNVAVGTVDAINLPRHPVGRQPAPPATVGANQKAEHLGQQPGVSLARHLAEIGNAANV
ncbi:MAG: hypothetical protein ACXW3N_14090, partial [Rhodoplanes sp.]